MNEGPLRVLQLHDFWADEHTLRLNVDDLTIHREELGQMLQASLHLQDLIISLRAYRTLESIEKTVEMWQGRSSPLQLTLVEYASDDRGHVVAQVVVSSRVYSHPGNSVADLQGSNVSFATAEFLQWNSDRVWEPLTNFTAALLNTATKQHPSVLTSFTVNISNLTQEEGLPHFQNILQQSMLGNLHICCTMSHANLSDSVRQVFLSIRWNTLRFLILSGAAVNEWIRFLATITEISLVDLRLQCPRIQGSGKLPIFLSHASMLFVHHIMCWNTSMELVLENVNQQEQTDSDLLPGILRS